MKLLDQYFTVANAEEDARKLNDEGVMTFISATNSHSMSPMSGAAKVGLWIVLNHQYLDAVELLRDPTHQVKNPITRAEMDELRESAEKQFSNRLVRYVYPVLVVIGVAVLGLFFYLYKLWEFQGEP